MKKTQKSKKIIFTEIILLLSSVFVFRSLWTLLDKIPLMNTNLFLIFSFIIAIIITILSYHYIINNSKK